MTRISSSARLWFSVLLALVVRLSAAEPASAATKVVPVAGDTIVFLGDSITAQCLYTQYVEHYFHTRFPVTRLHFHNAGVSGDTTADALARFDRDVAAYQPKYVTVLLGMNDGAAKVFEPALFDTYRADIEKLLGKIRAIGATPILLTPTIYDGRMALASGKPDSRGRGGYYNGVLALYGAWLHDFAAEQGAGFADLYAPLNQFTQQSRRTAPDFTLTLDGIHPDPGGQMIMAYALVSDLGLSKRSSTIEISRTPGGDAVSKATGGRVVDARYSEAGIEFTFLPAGLPMSVPEAAKAGAALIPLGHRLSYEALSVHGLAPGRYQLFINNQPIGEYSDEVFAAKLELETNEKTPEYQQSVRVAELNARRHAESVAPLRDLWRAKKTLERTRRELAAAPGDAALQKRVTAYERKLADFDAQVAALDSKSSQMEDEIYQANQPQTLRFKIVRTAAPSVTR
jgi:lysophospholipase L1-like esterase